MPVRNITIKERRTRWLHPSEVTTRRELRRDERALGDRVEIVVKRMQVSPWGIAYIPEDSLAIR